jgi:hypothetical protein
VRSVKLYRCAVIKTHGLTHVTLAVKDVRRSFRLYKRIFGLVAGREDLNEEQRGRSRPRRNGVSEISPSAHFARKTSAMSSHPRRQKRKTVVHSFYFNFPLPSYFLSDGTFRKISSRKPKFDDARQPSVIEWRLSMRPWADSIDRRTKPTKGAASTTTLPQDLSFVSLLALNCPNQFRKRAKYHCQDKEHLDNVFHIELH